MFNGLVGKTTLVTGLKVEPAHLKQERFIPTDHESLPERVNFSHSKELIIQEHYTSLSMYFSLLTRTAFGTLTCEQSTP